MGTDIEAMDGRAGKITKFCNRKVTLTRQKRKKQFKKTIMFLISSGSVKFIFSLILKLNKTFYKR